MKLWTWKEENLPSVGHAVRTAVAATLSVLLARLVGLPEAYWAVIATLVVMQSPLNRPAPWRSRGSLRARWAHCSGQSNQHASAQIWLAFAFTIFVLGLISIAFRLEKVGYSYAGMTLAIIVLIPRPEAPWIAAVHRFAEVSLGILVALAVVAVWREEQRLFGDAKAE